MLQGLVKQSSDILLRPLKARLAIEERMVQKLKAVC
jgi:hypothetical protein